MADGKLTYSLGLNTSAFTGMMRKAIGLVLSYKAVMFSLRQISLGFDLGEELKHLSMETGDTVGNLLVMKQTFQDVGMGSGELQTSLRLMRRSLTGISEMGQRTDEVFAALGLNLESLRGQDAITQFQAIGRAIGGLATQEDRVNAAMTIFGRSGSSMLRIFGNAQAFEQARDALGSMPEIMDKYAAKMEEIRTGWGRIRTAITGAFVGAIGPALPMLDQITQKINSIDFAKIGVGIASAFGAIKTVLFAIDPMEFATNLANVVFVALGAAVREAFALLFNLQFWSGVGKMLLGALAGLGAALIDAFAPAVAFLAAGVDQIIDELGNTLAWVQYFAGMKVTLGRPNLSFGEHYKNELSGQRNQMVTPAQESAASLFTSGTADFGKALIGAGAGIAQSVAESMGGQYFAGLGTQFGDEFSRRMAEALAPVEQAAAAAAQPTGEAAAAAGPGSPYEPASDRWSRVGAFVGDTVSAQALDFARQTAGSTATINRTASSILSAIRSSPPATI